MVVLKIDKDRTFKKDNDWCNSCIPSLYLLNDIDAKVCTMKFLYYRHHIDQDQVATNISVYLDIPFEDVVECIEANTDVKNQIDEYYKDDVVDTLISMKRTLAEANELTNSAPLKNALLGEDREFERIITISAKFKSELLGHIELYKQKVFDDEQIRKNINSTGTDFISKKHEQLQNLKKSK